MKPFLSLGPAVLLILFAAATHGVAGEPERAALDSQIRQEFKAGDYAALEKQALELEKARFPDGRWKIIAFSAALEPRIKGDETWDTYFKRLDDWKAAFPNSTAQPVVRAAALTSYAWDARGTGYADTVTPEGWKLMASRLAQARSVLEEAGKLPTRSQQWYTAMMTIALGQQWERPQYEQLFREAIAFEPGNYDFYLKKAYWLLPRWYGEDKEWERFADEANTAYGKEGLSLYTRIAWANSFFFNNLFRESAIEWPKMRQGFLDIEKQYPDSNWNLNSFYRFAVMAQDRETARVLLQRIGDKVDYDVWNGHPERFEAAKKWTEAN